MAYILRLANPNDNYIQYDKTGRANETKYLNIGDVIVTSGSKIYVKDGITGMVKETFTASDFATIDTLVQADAGDNGAAPPVDVDAAVAAAFASEAALLTFFLTNTGH